ncbi:hypothetical protein GCM10009665_16240 [Kitasatospora nipponensis]|uniref:Histidine kinase/HSP90-like ATPase domain-containing protein n=1 Tax=Kitasatospora nipponensis TaxID=258049 RepID=A0ABN1VX93_9ACTN
MIATAATPAPTTVADPVRAAACVLPAAVEAVPSLRHFARAMARSWHLPDSTRETLTLIVTELVTNVIRHSGSPDVALLLTSDAVTVTIQVRDRGQWRARSTGTALDACSGRGLHLVEAYAGCCSLRPTAVGTQVTAELFLPKPTLAR